MHIEVNGARIFFDAVGPQLSVDAEAMMERPSLIVMHGGPGFDHSIMRPWFDRFADTHQVIYLDHRGNGRSGGELETCTLDQWGDDVKALCDGLGITRPVVYGLSFGGMVAMAYAGRHPRHPAKLILASTAARMDLPAVYAMMQQLGGDEARTVAEKFWSEPSPEAAARYMSICMPLYNPGPDAGGEAARKRAIQRLDVMAHFIAGEQRTMDLTPDLARVACPTLVTAGTLDPITPVSCSREIFGALPSGLGQLEIFEGAGHGVHRTQPERAEASLRRFLATKD
ncbi:MAG TPA: alpha/beta hydrolase [Caulobacteraceae bacterium]